MTPIGWEDARAALAAILLYYFTGLPLARLLSRSAGGPALQWALPSSLGVLLGGVFLARLVGLDLNGAAWILAVIVILQFAAVFAAGARRPGRTQNAAGGIDPAEGAGKLHPTSGDAGRVRPIEWGGIVACTLALLAVGGPTNLLFDSLDHLTAIRRSWLSGQILPTDLFYRGGDGGGWDPRKGFLHPLHAFTCHVAGVDPLRLWRVLPAVFAPAVLLALIRFLRVWTGPGKRSDAALFLWILLGSGSGFLWLTKTGYPNHVAYPLAFLGAALLIEEMRGPSRRGRLAGIALLGFIGTLIHVVAGVLMALAAGLMLVSSLLESEQRRERVERVVRAGVVAALGLFPPLLFRILTQGTADSSLHTHPQGLLSLGGGILIASPFFILWHVGAAGVLAPFVLPLAARAAPRSMRRPLLLLVAVPWICVWTPLFTLLYHRIGYLVPRFLEIVPVPVVLILAAEESIRLLRTRRRSVSVVYGAAALLVSLLLALRAGIHLPLEVRDAAKHAHGVGTPDAFSRALAAIPPSIRGRTPPVVLSDPFTSFALSGVTGAHVVATLNQHGPPTDRLWRDRLDDQRDMLQGTAGVARIDSLLTAYEVDAVFVNAALPLPISEFGSRVDRKWVDRALAHFSSDPQRFPVLYSGAEGLVAAIGPAPAARTPAPAAPAPAAAPESWGPASGPYFFGALEAIDVRLPTRPFARGGAIPIILSWRRTGEVPTDLPLTAHVRMQTAVPSHWFTHRIWSKPARLLVQRFDRRVYRQRIGTPLLQGSRNPARLPMGAAFADTLILPIPREAAPGEWAVTLTVVEEAFLPNVRLRDLLSDEDNFVGPVIGHVTVH